jgi:hypothetical protein
MMLWTLLLGCDLLPTPPPTPNCDPRTIYHPDEDGDGLGERDRVYVGCAPPEGWVTEVAPTPLPDPPSDDTGAS